LLKEELYDSLGGALVTTILPPVGPNLGGWIIAEGSLAAEESTQFLVSLGFAQLDLSKIYCFTVPNNKRVVQSRDR
jgi:hypothetical protein